LVGLRGGKKRSGAVGCGVTVNWGVGMEEGGGWGWEKYVSFENDPMGEKNRIRPAGDERG